MMASRTGRCAAVATSSRITRISAALLASSALLLSSGAVAETSLADAYGRAEKVLDANLATALRNGDLKIHWQGRGESFWYERQGAAGAEFVQVDSATGRRGAAFDAAALRTKLKQLPGIGAVPDTLPVTAITADAVSLKLGDKAVRCALPALRCDATTAPAGESDTAWAPDGQKGVFVQGHDLWLRTKGRTETTRLTNDGAEHNAYGALPGGSLTAIPLMRAKAPLPPFGIAWSPSGRFFMSDRYDERAVEPYPFVESVPQDGGFRPVVWQPRIPLLGQAKQAKPEQAIFDTTTGSKTVVQLPEPWSFANSAVQWSADGRSVYGWATTRGSQDQALVEVDLATGKVRFVIKDKTPKFGRLNAFIYSPPNLRILDASREVLWYSERDGWGQLYLYDLRSGKLKRKLTPGPRTVRDIIGVDEARRRLFFTSGGSDADDDPYQVKLYSVSLDGGAARLLTPEAGTHRVARDAGKGGSDGSLSPDRRWIVESYSDVARPPVTVLRDAADGHVVTLLETADASAITAAGWRPPTRVKMIAADGRTPIWGTVYFPPRMEPGRKYPVIDAIYGGPQVTVAPTDYKDAVSAMNPRARASLAELGFIVVTIDGRGTPGRSKAFNDASFESFAEAEIADHVGGIRQLAQRYGSFDLDRVGIYGHSFGGYTSSYAILAYPDFYKVAVSSAGPYNFQGFYPVEGVFPVTDYGQGRDVQPSPDAVPVNYRKLDLMPLASRLKGKLMLAYGDLDENALPAVTLQFVDALTKANRPYDLMYLPNRNHNFFRTDAYYTQRMWDYFVEHLLHETPPSDFNLKLIPPPAPAGH